MAAFGYSGAKNPQPVGSIIQAPYNLTDPDWLPCDGRKVSRSQYPALSACLPNIGTFTATSRTKIATPSSNAIANNGTIWVVTGDSTASNPLWYTPDGITYTQGTGIAAVGFDCRAVLWDGTNFVAMKGGSGTANAAYSANGSSWTISASTTGIASTGQPTALALAPSLGTVGRFCSAGGGLNFYTSDDHGVTWTARAHGLGGNVFHVCWTGQKFIATTNVTNTIYTSTDGITWVSQAMPFYPTACSAVVGSIISDGNGKVLWVDASGATVNTSLDHGVTWGQRTFGNVKTLTGGQMPVSGAASYTNGRFFLFSADAYSPALVSTDLVGWAFSDSGANISNGTISYKSGVYLANASASNTAAYTFTEDTSYMHLPYAAQNETGGTVSWNNYMPFIKVR